IMDEIKYQTKDIEYKANKELDQLNREAMNAASNNSGKSLDESRVAYANFLVFFVMLALVILALSGFAWAGYAFVVTIYTIFINSLIKKKILLSKRVYVPTVDMLIVIGARAVFLSSLIIIVITLILLLIHTN